MSSDRYGCSDCHKTAPDTCRKTSIVFFYHILILCKENTLSVIFLNQEKRLSPPFPRLPLNTPMNGKPFSMDFSIPRFPIAHPGCFPPSSLLSAALFLGTSPAFIPLIALHASSFLLYCGYVSGALSLASCSLFTILLARPRLVWW